MPVHRRASVPPDDHSTKVNHGLLEGSASWQGVCRQHWERGVGSWYIWEASGMRRRPAQRSFLLLSSSLSCSSIFRLLYFFTIPGGCSPFHSDPWREGSCPFLSCRQQSFLLRLLRSLSRCMGLVYASWMSRTPPITSLSSRLTTTGYVSSHRTQLVRSDGWSPLAHPVLHDYHSRGS